MSGPTINTSYKDESYLNFLNSMDQPADSTFSLLEEIVKRNLSPISSSSEEWFEDAIINCFSILDQYEKERISAFIKTNNLFRQQNAVSRALGIGAEEEEEGPFISKSSSSLMPNNIAFCSLGANVEEEEEELIRKPSSSLMPNNIAFRSLGANVEEEEEELIRKPSSSLTSNSVTFRSLGARVEEEEEDL